MLGAHTTTTANLGSESARQVRCALRIVYSIVGSGE